MRTPVRSPSRMGLRPANAVIAESDDLFQRALNATCPIELKLGLPRPALHYQGT
ncbi:hypothetical protein N2599_33775 (plasmid) [Rhizobium sullae]|uniref:Uncharacterized protein n=1 Tax=Rhizobium sullae TaxID=50338 RepID=A0ABY5XST5_RHISU|nr:hypothetical protein [Rhizobium sullae]UWU17685.1 hypothetical protein N2599_33775 [Rhizobium sullae]